MEDQQHTVSVVLAEINCGKCGGVYAISERYRQHKYDRGGTWHCPYCQTSWGYTESEVQRLERALEAKRRREANLEAELKRSTDMLVAQRAATTRMKNRVAKGVCPCCKRSFVDLRKHMACKHKDFAKE